MLYWLLLRLGLSLISHVVSAVLRVVGGNGNLMVQLVLIIELSATNARTEPAELAYILANYSQSSGMVGVVMICNYARQAPRAASQEARMCDVIAWPTVAS